MEMISAIVIGFVAGVASTIIWPRKDDPFGVLQAILLGIAGALFAGTLGGYTAWYGLTELNGLVCLMIGAIIALLVGKLASRRRIPVDAVHDS